MMKEHCDNCDALVLADAVVERRVTVEPLGYNCTVTVMVTKNGQQVLCADCLRKALLRFALDIPELFPPGRSSTTGGVEFAITDHR